MIRLYDKSEASFTTLGLGSLSDAISCIVTEELNGAFELEMTYPIVGSHFSDITLKSIIYTKPNSYDDPQPFRVYSISKPINGIVTINAEHISYDASGYTIRPFEAEGLSDALSKIQNGGVINHPFVLTTDMTSDITMSVTHPYSLRSLLSGSDGSLTKIYGGELKFNKFAIQLLEHRGSDRGFEIRYGKNMTDLEVNQDSTKMYTGVFPYYYTETTETETTTEKYFEEAYIVGSTPLASDWLSLSEGGEPFYPIVEDAPIQIQTEGEYKDKIYCWDLTNQTYYETPNKEPTLTRTVSEQVEKKIYVDLNTSVEAYIVSGSTAFSSGWLTLVEGGNPFNPVEGRVYKIKTAGQYFNTLYQWNGTAYTSYSSDGIIWIDSTITPKKILTLDLSSEFSEEPTPGALKIRTNAYITDNKIGDVTESVDTSFIKLSESSEYASLAQLEKVLLGDTVKVIFIKGGVSKSLLVTATEYDSVTEKYNSISLGDKEESLSDTAICTNDNISALTNDKKYTDYTTVNNLIAKCVTADYIQACNAELSTAQINELTTARIQCSGIIEASIFDIDKVVSSRIVAEDAEISNILKAGSVEIKGKITATSGEIGGCNIIDGVLTVKDIVCNQIITDGLPSSSSVVDTVTTGLFNNVTSLFRTSFNNLLVSGVLSVKGNIEVTSGSISISNSTYGTSFSVDTRGRVTANSLALTGGTISLSGRGTAFSVDANGRVTANSITATGGKIGNWSINDYSLFFNGTASSNNTYCGMYAGNASSSSDYYFNGGSVRLYIGTHAKPNESSFFVTDKGKAVIKNASIMGDLSLGGPIGGTWSAYQPFLSITQSGLFIGSHFNITQSNITITNPGWLFRTADYTDYTQQISSGDLIVYPAYYDQSTDTWKYDENKPVKLASYPTYTSTPSSTSVTPGIMRPTQSEYTIS